MEWAVYPNLFQNVHIFLPTLDVLWRWCSKWNRSEPEIVCRAGMTTPCTVRPCPVITQDRLSSFSKHFVPRRNLGYISEVWSWQTNSCLFLGWRAGMRVARVCVRAQMCVLFTFVGSKPCFSLKKKKSWLEVMRRVQLMFRMDRLNVGENMLETWSWDRKLFSKAVLE